MNKGAILKMPQEPHHMLAVQLLVYQDLLLDVGLIAPLFLKQLLLDYPGCASSVPLYVPENTLATPPPPLPLGTSLQMSRPR